MRVIKNIRRKIVYALTKKPSCYVHVDKPKTLQEERQVDYNKWCKRHHVYNGAYLPTNPDTLLKKGKGWVEVSNSANQAGESREFVRKSDGQKVRYDKENARQHKHYHWYNKKKKSERYFDRYGISCAKGSMRSHLAPLDKKYKRKKK